ncbi:MAG: RagB/SusD family nutrient uptake outer membrane protein [Prevotella sp.]|nr:RagB/SusD family nutrient uptake outer membrane protein [Prevotella sp.]
MKTTIKYISLGLVATLGLASCSDSFLEDKKNYDNVNAGIYDYYSGALGRVNDLYGWCLPRIGDLSYGGKYLSVSVGMNDIAGGSTEEFHGFSSFVDPQIELSSASGTNSVPDYFMQHASDVQSSSYGRIRNCNDVIRGISDSKLSQDEKDELLGQAYFFRAWCYYNLMRWYGGVPIVTEVLDPVVENFTERSGVEETKNFIVSDLNKSAELLKAKTSNGGWSGSNYGRVTSGTALALKGRVLQLWCSPLFNRSNDQSRWQDAYNEMKADLATINACGYGLYQGSNNINGSDFAMQFLQSTKNPEAVFVVLFNNVANDDGLDNQKNSTWERAVRPYNTKAAGCGSGMQAGLMLIQQFPMKDGKIPAAAGTYSNLETSQYAYDENCPFMNRDPRFYRTFTFPGFRWAYSGNASLANSFHPSDGPNYTAWNYVWYTNEDDQGNVESGNSYGSDNLTDNKRSVYVRKKSDDLDVNSSPLYNYEPTYTKNAAPFFSAQPYIELRYAEVLLNLAEVACGAGDMSYAVQLLKQVRTRAGYTGDCGLQGNLSGNQAACMSAILYERQIEFAYEGKRFEDMRRWMLFDGGAEKVQGAPASWTLTGWNGNTCNWLGVKPMNGQRRETIEFRTADKYDVGTTLWNSDPLVATAIEAEAQAYVNSHSGVTLNEAKALPEVFYAAAAKVRPEGVDLRKELDPQLESLKAWYNDNLVTAVKKGDSYDSNHQPLYIKFRPQYYLLGLASGAQNNNKGLPQTIGWEVYNGGGAMGTFDPFAETHYWSGE